MLTRFLSRRVMRQLQIEAIAYGTSCLLEYKISDPRVKIMSKFLEYKGAQFSVGDVEDYLAILAEKGWKVSSRRNAKGYVIDFDDDKRINIYHNTKTNEWLIQEATCMDGRLPFDYEGLLNTFSQFEEWIVSAAKYYEVDLDSAPSKVRLKTNEPASNRVSLSKLASSAKVECIFDPYFDDQSLATLMTLMNLGMKIDENARVLTTKKIKKRLSHLMISSFEQEYQVSLDIRFCASVSEHRRFMLLSNGETIVLGCSLNSIDKNEAAHREYESFDRAFFDEEWKISEQLLK